MLSTSKTALSLAVGAAIISVPAAAAKPGEETSGNNLATPVIWAEGISKPLRTYNNDPQAVLFNGLTSACNDFPGEICYQQQDPDNIWQAESWPAATSDTTSYGTATTTGAITDGLLIDEVDWGDNLEARDWNVNSIIRLEVVLWQLLGGDGSGGLEGNHPLPPMTAFEMSYLFGQGPSEMWGTTMQTGAGAEATVYSDCARLTIQKIAALDQQIPDLVWDAANTRWSNAPTFVNSAVWEAGTGPGFFSAEINISGKVIYGYSWNVRKLGDGDGIYRLTFSLDGTGAASSGAQQCGTTNPAPLNTRLIQAAIRLPAEEEEIAAAEEGDTGGGVAAISAANNLTYIDIKILPRSGGGGAGGGKPDGGMGNGNGHGNGGPKRN